MLRFHYTKFKEILLDCATEKYNCMRWIAMKKTDRHELLTYLILTLVTLFYCWLFCFRNGVFGSKVDWISQHSVFPDYFRQLFYETGQLFPEFAPGIGGGQNIYHFSYYGLYSPVVLLSYLLPWAEMGTYLMAAMVVSLIAATALFYYWQRRKGISCITALGTSVLFLLSGPMIYHSYNQIMFVNYMPFLCLALIGVDRYFEKQKSGIYLFGVWMMILTSFYFSIGGMLVLALYGFYRYTGQKEEKGERISFRIFLRDGIRFLLPMIIAVLLSAVLLVPTACVLSNGRSGGNHSSLWKLLIPDLHISRFLYTPYGIGLTTLIISVLISGLASKKYHEKLLHVGLIFILSVPVFAWLLNGGLYVREKVFIPFLPLLCYLIAEYVEKAKEQGGQDKKGWEFLSGLLPFLITLLLLFVEKWQGGSRNDLRWLIADGLIMSVSFLICYRRDCMRFLLIPPIIFLTVNGAAYHEKEQKFIDPAFYAKITNPQIRETIEKTAEEEPGFYRIEQYGDDEENAADLNRIWSVRQSVSSFYSSVYHEDYYHFRTKLFGAEQPYRNLFMQPASGNPVFRKFMGVKYVISDREIPGYEKISENVYEDKDALPIAYVTKQLISEDEYGRLGFPERQLALLRYAVAEDACENSVNREKLRAGLQKVSLPSEKKIDCVKDSEHTLEIPPAKEGDLFFLQFRVSNHRPSHDVAVWAECIRNKLTAETHIYYNENKNFTYAIPLREGQTKISVRFGAGDYEIDHLKGYLWRKAVWKEQNNGHILSEFIADKTETKGNRIKGTAKGEKDSYLITSIPYESSFEVLVDGKATEYEKVNTAFLGLKIPEGEHEIEIVYHAPGLLPGKILSLLGAGCFFLRKKFYCY